jgi:hypothetical protein
MGFRGQFARQQSRTLDVRFGSKAAATADGDRVCFTPESGHQSVRLACPLWAKGRRHPSFVLAHNVYCGRTRELQFTIRRKLHLNLMAFPNVASVAGIELAEVAVAGLKADRVIISYTALRGFIERTAHAAALAEALAPIKLAPIDGPLYGGVGVK